MKTATKIMFWIACALLLATSGCAVDAVEHGRTCDPLAFEQPRELEYEFVAGDCHPLSRPAYQPPMAVPNCEVLVDQTSTSGCQRDLVMHCRNGDVESTATFEIEQRGPHLFGRAWSDGFCRGEWTFRSAVP